MPPKPAAKEKVVSVKGDEAEELVLQYLKQVNRPYASTDVSANLKNKVSKANAQKVLTSLAEKGSLTMKMYGKQSVFVYNQADLETLPAESLAEVEAGIKAVADELDSMRKKVKSLTSELAARIAQPRTEDLQSAIEKLEYENSISEAHLEPLRAASKNTEGSSPGSDGGQGPMSSAEIELTDREWVKWRKEWVERRKVYMRGLDAIQPESGRGERVEFEEAEGIENDPESALEIENGELCKPVRAVKKPVGADSGRKVGTPSTPGKKVPVAGDKRKRL